MNASNMTQMPIWYWSTATTNGAFFVFCYKEAQDTIFGRPKEMFFKELFSAVDQSWCKTIDDLYKGLQLGRLVPEVTIDNFAIFLRGVKRGLLEKQRVVGLNDFESSFLGPLGRLVPD